MRAALLGVATALAVALTTSPDPFGITDAATALARGSWIGWIVVPYIFGGVLFWQTALRTAAASGPAAVAAPDARARRRQLFAACFLIGPFAESATGFGVGIVGTMALVRRLDVPPVPLLVFGLLSQTLILWGGMGSGIIVGAAFARTDPAGLALHASWFLVAFHVFWLPMFWQVADRAGVPGSWRERLGEVAWLAAGLAGAVAATALLGAECALLAAYAPLIVLRYLLDERPRLAALVDTGARMWPFALLVGWLAASRLLPPVAGLLSLYRIQPFGGGPTWVPFFHAGTWLVAAAVVVALVRGHAGSFGRELGRAWATSRLAILSVVAFSTMAELLAGSGIASAFASGLYGVLGPSAVAVTAFVSAVFGALANSGSAPNGLFMASQVSLARDAALDVPAVIAFQYAAALSLNIISPVRMSIVCGLADLAGMERAAWRAMLPFTLGALLVLFVAALLICGRAV